MLQSIVMIVIKMLISSLSEENRIKLESEVAALKGREESIGESYKEQDKARKESETTDSDVAGTESDLFGSESYGGKE